MNAKTIVPIAVVLAVVVIGPLLYGAFHRKPSPDAEVFQQLQQWGENVRATQQREVEQAAQIELTAHSAGPWQDTSSFARPPQGAYLFAIDLEVFNGSDTPVMVNPFGISLIDDAGRSCKSSMLSTPEPALSSRTIAPNDRARGWICFEVVNGSTPERIEFLVSPVSNAVATLDL